MAQVGLSAQEEVGVKFADFLDAVSRLPKMKRSPQGARGKIPTDTLLLANANGISVETPAIASVVRSDGVWAVNISVDARRLFDACVAFKEHGGAPDVVSLSVKNQKLWFRFRTTESALPAFPA